MLTTSSSPAPVYTSQSMFWLIQALPLLFCFGSGNAASQSSSSTMVVNGVVGESVTLPVKFPAEKKIQAVSWSYNMTFIGICQPSEMTNTLILNPANNKKMNYTQSCFLHFSNLTRKDSGPYRAQINTLTFETLFFDFALRVFERLHNLQVSHHIQLSGNGTCEIHLTCYVENPDDSVSFEWQLSENIFLNETNLTVSWDSKDSRDQSYVCTAKNSVSNVSFPVSAKNLCKDILTKDNLHWKNLTWIIICVILIITFILMIICKKKTDALHLPTQRPGLEGDSEASGHLKVTPHPRGPLDNTELASISPGSTVYAQVTHSQPKVNILPHTKNNDSATIYSTVNHFKQNKSTSSCASALYIDK
ncbi:SLAM family member 6 isoform X2 [Cavia porcellus]|uniref:SLAM family member 6 isoform X2 n=1 Tax=Cavia porcellus TaxID=10141 RepID=UPI002FE10BFB